MADATWQVPVPLAATMRCRPGRYYRFPFTYRAGIDLSLCLVEVILGGGISQPIIIFHGLEIDSGHSLTNNIEHAAAAVCDLVKRDLAKASSIQWIQAPEYEDDRWSEVTFQTCEYDDKTKRWKLEGPSWRTTEPVRFDETSDDQEMFYAIEYRPIPDDDPFELDFGEVDCHERRTGRCSLELDRPVDDYRGEGSWGYCRGLADIASLWMFVKDYLCKDGEELGGLFEAVSAARSGWSAPYGTIDDVNDGLVMKAHKLYRTPPPRASWIESGCWSFLDGQHRWCSARRAGLAVPVELEVPRRRLDGDASTTAPLDGSDT